MRTPGRWWRPALRGMVNVMLILCAQVSDGFGALCNGFKTLLACNCRCDFRLSQFRQVLTRSPHAHTQQLTGPFCGTKLAAMRHGSHVTSPHRRRRHRQRPGRRRHCLRPRVPPALPAQRRPAPGGGRRDAARSRSPGTCPAALLRRWPSPAGGPALHHSEMSACFSTAHQLRSHHLSCLS